MLNTLQRQLLQCDSITIVKYDNAGYTIYTDNTLKTVIAHIYTHKNKRGILIYNEHYTMKQIKKLFKQYKKLDKIVK